MAESRRYALNAQLDIEQILLESQHRWLRPAEICEILQNYKKFCICSEPPNRPPSGSLFLFDRKVLRYFRKDGHNWRKKKDGKTVKEAHERLKAGSVDVLHCYYAHGEENENFQRRSYWMLEEELSHIVLVHYREVKGNRTNFNRLRDADSVPDSRLAEDITSSEVDSSGASRFQSYDYQGASQVTDTTSLNSSQASEHEDAESVYRHHTSPGFHSIHELQSPALQKMELGSIRYPAVPTSSSYQGHFSSIPGMHFGSITQGDELQPDLVFSSWGNVVERSNADYQTINFQSSLPLAQSSATSTIPGQENELLDQVVSGVFGRKQEFGSNSDGLEEWQASGRESLNVSNWFVDQNSDDNLNFGQNPYFPSLRQPLLDQTTKQNDQNSDDNLNFGQNPYYPSLRQPLLDQTTTQNDVNQVELCVSVGLHNAYQTEQIQEPMQNDPQTQALNAVGSSLEPYSGENLNLEDKSNYPALKQPLLDVVRGLTKLDSFDRWISKELGDVAEPNVQPGSAPYWKIVGTGDGDESDISTQVPPDFILGPSLSQDQLFSIIDFSPNWAYSGSEIKVLVMGRFLGSKEELEKYKWACMFGELEVPAEIIADGVLRCHTPSPHETGRVPFYVTCSNRLACSEVREFEFRTTSIQDVDLGDVGSIPSDETLLHMRFGKLLSLGSGTSQTSFQSVSAEISELCHKISALLKDDSEWEQMLNFTKQDELSAAKIKDQLLQKLLKEKLHAWLLQKTAEGGKGPSVIDEDGQGVLHFAAALGYDWAIPPTITAGVSVNFRDANGWTALHWAAHNGREHTVAFLISLGAAPGLLTDPTAKYPSGRTPSDLAYSNGHKGIAGYLAEAALSSHLSSLTVKDSNESHSGEKAVETVSDRIATPVGYGDLPHGLSLKDSLAAVRNATQAAARIHQMYRVQSFQRNQLEEYCDSEFGMSEERALSLLVLKTNKAGQPDEPVAAAIRIQNQFRSWKGRKEFLLLRQNIIKIQAHVRGHQVRKNYRKIIWSVGILDKVILRWRRKGRGLSGFKPEANAAGTSMLDAETMEDDYDFLKQGRKQTEQRLQKALARVKSMVQYPDARDQYRRVLNVVSEMQEKKATYDKVLNNPEGDLDDDLIDLDALLEDDTLMPTAS